MSSSLLFPDLYCSSAAVRIAAHPRIAASSRLSLRIAMTSSFISEPGLEVGEDLDEAEVGEDLDEARSGKDMGEAEVGGREGRNKRSVAHN